MPRPRSLTTAQLAAAALAVIDREGLDALTMRAVAAELGTSTMGLYRYVDGREQLEALVVELVLDGVDTTPGDGTGWRGEIGLLAERVRVAVSAHPAVVPLLVTHRHRSPHLLRWSEAVLGILTTAGYDGPARVTALRAITAYMVGVLQMQHLGPLAGAGTKVIAAQTDFPLMAGTARDAAAVTPEAEFGAGLSALLNGLTPR